MQSSCKTYIHTNITRNPWKIEFRHNNHYIYLLLTYYLPFKESARREGVCTSPELLPLHFPSSDYSSQVRDLFTVAQWWVVVDLRRQARCTRSFRGNGGIVRIERVIILFGIT